MSRPAPTTRESNLLDESGARPIPSGPNARADDVDALLEELGGPVAALAPPKLDRTEMVPAWFLPALAGIAFSIGVIGTTTALELYRDAQPTTTRALATAAELAPPETRVVQLAPFEFVVDVPSSEVRADRDEALTPAIVEAPEPLMSEVPVLAESSLPLSASTDHEVDSLIGQLATRPPGTGASASLASPLSR